MEIQASSLILAPAVCFEMCGLKMEMAGGSADGKSTKSDVS